MEDSEGLWTWLGVIGRVLERSRRFRGGIDMELMEFRCSSSKRRLEDDEAMGDGGTELPSSEEVRGCRDVWVLIAFRCNAGRMD